MASRIASSSPRARAAALAALAAAILIVVLPASSAAVRPPFLACLVTGVGGPEDESFDQLAVAGLHAAETRGVVGRVVRGTSQADYVQELSSCAENGAGITIGVGYELATAVDQTATMFPRAAFAIVDVDVRTLTHRPANVEGLVFKQQQAGYLAGYLAGLWAARRGGKAVGSIGGLDIPPVDRALAGFRFGAKRAKPGLTVLSAYSGDFAGSAKCEEEAREQIAKGSVVEFQVAGPCGAGSFSAARAKGISGIGFGADQSSFGPTILTSVLERADVAVATAVRSARSGQSAGGANVIFGAGNGGITVGRWSSRVGAAVRRAVARQFALLKAGKIPGIPTTVQ
jgi:basic membrane protein A and related proteins